MPGHFATIFESPPMDGPWQTFLNIHANSRVLDISLLYLVIFCGVIRQQHLSSNLCTKIFHKLHELFPYKSPESKFDLANSFLKLSNFASPGSIVKE